MCSQLFRKITAFVVLLFLICSCVTISDATTEDEEVLIALGAENSQVGRANAYIARVMQGNTNEEDDCREVVNGLIDSGSYSISGITTSGWSYTNANTSTINHQRAGATEFLYSRLYHFAYFSGHGSHNGGVTATLNVYSALDPCDGSATTFNVAETLKVNNSTWETDSLWTKNDKLKVLVVAACKQLDSTVVRTYARAMKASNIRAIAGYHEKSPTHNSDMYVAIRFFNKANESNSVKFSWSDANTTAEKVSPWAVLVYTEKNNEYFRIPGFPGNTYEAPSADAPVYRFRSGLTSSEKVVCSTASISDEIPLYISTVESRTASQPFNSREAVSANSDLPINTAITDEYVKDFLNTEELGNLMCMQTPVYRDEVDFEEGGIVEGTETIVERIYHYYNTFRGIKIVDAAVVLGVDKDGIYSVQNFWKEASAVESGTQARSVSIYDMLSEEEALSALMGSEYDDFELLRSDLVYAPVEHGSSTHKLAYELVSTDGQQVFVDVELGTIIG